MNKLVIYLATVFLAACGVAPKTTNAPIVQKQDPLMDLVKQQPAVPQKPAEMPFFNQPTTSVAYTGFAANPNVQQFMAYQQQHNGISPTVLSDFFSRVQHKQSLINTMDKPATSRPWYEFQKGNSGAVKINGGKRFYAANRHAIDQAARDYGVPAEIIVAIIGIETNYGANMGNVRVADSLATLAFDYPRRGAYFQKELGEFLKVAQEENRDPLSFSGSFAGAMGMPQFMPSSFRKWAVDYDRNGSRDIWRSVPDVAASVANYMKVHGWQTGGKVIVPVSLQITPQLQAILDEKTSLKYTVGQLRQMGVMPLEAVSDNEKAVLYRLETAPNQYAYYIGLTNFYAIWQYNHSRMYVTAVRDIANGVGGGNL